MATLLFYNANPLKLRTRDCVYRAISVFLGVGWRDALDEIVRWAADRGRTNFNYRSNYNEFLKEKGYERNGSPEKGITVAEFCERYAEKGRMYILSCPGHLTVATWPEHLSECVIVDTWDCSAKVVDGYWMRESRPIRKFSGGCSGVFQK